MDILCGICGVEEALNECISCNKKFCIDDWDKNHSDKQHERLAINFSVNEESRKFLINFFEKLKEKALIVLNTDKYQTFIERKDYILIYKKYVDVNLLWNAVIFYIMKVKIITKKLIYHPIECFLINSQVLAEKYAQFFNLSYFKDNPIDHAQDILMYNYLIYEPINFYSEDLLGSLHRNLWFILPDILTRYLIGRKYKTVLELLENLKGLLMFHKWLKFDINDLISMIQTFISQILHQNSNINLNFWKKAENKVNKCGNYYGIYIFYIVFQAIFYNLMNRKYFARCYTRILKITRTSSQITEKRVFMENIYKLIIEFYGMENNYDIYAKYMRKRLHLFEKNGKLLNFGSYSIHSVLSILNDLIDIYYYTNQIVKKKKCADKFLYFSRNYKPNCLFKLFYCYLIMENFFILMKIMNPH